MAQYEFRDAYESWHRHFEVALKCKHPGDVLLLADEAPSAALRLEGRRMAGKALIELKQYALALEQIEAALQLDPTDASVQHDRHIVLDRLGRHDEAPSLPRRVFLFSGHMIDAPDRATPRFPADKEGVAADTLGAQLDALGMGANDLAICGGACGGDILFAEATLARGCPVQLHLQFREADFLRDSVAFAGKHWVDRFHALKANALTSIRVQPDDLGPPPDDVNPYERNNLWQLYTALALGADKVHFIGLWNGAGGAGPGGTRHMVDEVRKHAGRVFIVDTRSLTQ